MFAQRLPAGLLSQVAYGVVFAIADSDRSNGILGARAATITSLLMLGVPETRAIALVGVLTAQGLPAADVDAAWEAIALHTTAQIAVRRGALSLLLREGICVDFGGVIGSGTVPDTVTEEEARAIHEACPRLSMVSSIVEAMATQAARLPANGPRYSVGGELLRERGNPPRRTRMEEAALSSRWGSCPGPAPTARGRNPRNPSTA
ncbi:hypothetical protein [Streptomyces shenzhenensis]|uniref:hypothetical protein n=1 Tax=Streptomyces shenzhenensis TaxID=943815 RepID=UPI001F3FAF21|nr:hypothetical protein [Streptomyces shenzhenensis]